MRGEEKHNKNSICLIIIKRVLFPLPSKQKEEKTHSLNSFYVSKSGFYSDLNFKSQSSNIFKT